MNKKVSSNSNEDKPLMCKECKEDPCKDYCEAYKKKYLRKRFDGGRNSEVM
jgi:hypothetical protein